MALASEAINFSFFKEDKMPASLPSAILGAGFSRILKIEERKEELLIFFAAFTIMSYAD